MRVSLSHLARQCAAALSAETGKYHRFGLAHVCVASEDKKDRFQWLLGICKKSDGRSVYEEWLPKDENTIDGFRCVLEYGQKESHEKYRLRRRGRDIYFLIIDSKAACSVELKMNFLCTGEKPLILGSFPSRR